MKRIGIIGAMEEEVKLLKEKMIDFQQCDHYGFQFFTGKLSGKEVVLVRSGIGKVNATLSVVLMVEKFAVDLIINTGSAGGVSPELAVGDLVIADALIHHDVDLLAFGYEKGQMAGMPTTYQPDETAVELAYQLAQSQGRHVHKGLIASGDQFINNNQQVQKIRQDLPEVLALEMESAAIAQAAYVLKTPFLIIRSISDKADDEAGVSFEEYIVLASQVSAEMVMGVLAQFA